jgi:5-methylcytosine-specific restriction endonuclease McrA
MKRTGFLPRTTPLRSKRPTPRAHKLVVRLTGANLEALRRACWTRDRGICQECGVSTFWEARYDTDPMAYEMAHRRNKRMYGDSLENTRCLCKACHRASHGGC